MSQQQSGSVNQGKGSETAGTENGAKQEEARDMAAAAAAATAVNGTNSEGASTKDDQTKPDEAAATPSVDLSTLIPPVISTSLSTSGLEYRLRQLRDASTQHSQILTQKLASSQSGQNLLHMGTSLSTLPPDLHNLLQQLHPLVQTVEDTETRQLQRLETLVGAATQVQQQARRVQQARAAAHLYADLQAAERAVKHYQQHAQQQQQGNSKQQQRQQPRKGDSSSTLELDEVAPLERAAHITLCLLADLTVANERVNNITAAALTRTTSLDGPDVVVGGKQPPVQPTGAAGPAVPSLRTPLQDDTESAQFLMELAPRIRRLESDTVQALLQAMEELLLQVQEIKSGQQQQPLPPANGDDTSAKEAQLLAAAPISGNSVMSIATESVFSEEDGGAGAGSASSSSSELDLLLMLGHCMRGLAILGRGSEVESIFARVAIMPLIRSKVSMGRLDEGGSRGECAGLFSLLDEMATSIQQTYGPVLCLGETMFWMESSATTTTSSMMDVDLLTAGVWVPIATALMADAAIKMAIFSPGIASILQANYLALDTFLSELAGRLLLLPQPNSAGPPDASDSRTGAAADDVDDFLPALSQSRIDRAQNRIYTHPKTAEFSKRWNLPIYYQLRFGESCNRLNKAVDQTKKEGWIAQVFSGSEDRAEELKNQIGFELTLFLELYDILTDLWRPDVILKPLTNRFLRGAVQLAGRTVAFISESMDGKIKFGHEIQQQAATSADNGGSNSAAGGENGDNALVTPSAELSIPTRAPYCWGDSEDDVAAVAWELTILESAFQHDYVDTVCSALQTGDTDDDDDDESTKELRALVGDVLRDASSQIHPIIDKAWNDIIVKLLTGKCSAPLSAVKGVAVMYRMTNRPPPTQPSSFVGTIFRPLKEFTRSFTNRTPESVGSKWKQQIVVTVSDRYAVAVDELLTTVQRTEVALKNRKARRIAAGGMSDGEKLKLQLYLDYKHFSQTVREVGVEPSTVAGLSKLKDLTAEGEALQLRQQNGT